MPFKSQKQRGKIFELEKQGKIKPGTAQKFQDETPPGKLPEYAPKPVAPKPAKAPMPPKPPKPPKITSVGDIEKFRKGKYNV